MKGEPCSDGRPRYRPLFSRDDLRDHLKEYAENPGEWRGTPPLPDNYMPELPEGDALGYQLYETTTEGTPCSPVFASLGELAAWCATSATVVAGHRWTQEEWLASFKAGTLDVDSLLWGD